MTSVVNFRTHRRHWESREILCKHGIDPYCGCANLALTKNWCHSKDYAKHVLKRLVDADKQGKSIVVKTLTRLAIDHDKCDFADKSGKTNKYDELD